MTPEQTQQYVNTTVAFLNRANLSGQEAETMVEVKRWLNSLVKQAAPNQETNNG